MLGLSSRRISQKVIIKISLRASKLDLANTGASAALAVTVEDEAIGKKRMIYDAMVGGASIAYAFATRYEPVVLERKND